MKIVAENSIVSTTAGDDPLFRLEGQDQLDQLGNKIRWEARKVAYHRIKTYRRDEIVQTGSLPRTYDRENWTRAFLPKDESPMLGNVKFLHEADASPAAWKLGLDDLRLDPDSPAAAGRARSRQDPLAAARRRPMNPDSPLSSRSRMAADFAIVSRDRLRSQRRPTEFAAIRHSLAWERTAS